jgi:hypothetical protein
MIQLNSAVWRKSTRSGSNGGDCVEIADNLPAVVVVRDSKDPDGPVLTFDRDQWRAFIRATRAGEFDL